MISSTSCKAPESSQKSDYEALVKGSITSSVGNFCLQPHQQDSLLSLALCDADFSAVLYPLAHNSSSVVAARSYLSPLHYHATTNTYSTHGAAHPNFSSPFDEYRDLSLQQILEMSKDFLPDDESCEGLDEDPLMPNPVFPLSTTSNHLGTQTHAATSAAQDIYQPLPLTPSSDLELEPVPLASILQRPPQPMALTSISTNLKKRFRDEDDEELLEEDDDEEECNDQVDSDGIFVPGATSHRFRAYQKGQWAIKYDELIMYRQRFGDCLVPHTYKENLPLARWVKRQRYQYKLMMENKPSTMTKDRAEVLERIGFVWDSQGAAWYERLGELRAYKQRTGNCNVPTNFPENPQLATWVKCQRRQYKLYQDGRPSNITPHRLRELDRMGFEWEVRSSSKRQRQMNSLSRPDETP